MAKSLKPISSTYLFGMYDQTLNLQKRTIDLIKSGQLIDADMIQLNLIDIQRRYHYPLKSITVQDFEQQKYNLLYNGQNKSLPNAMPVLLLGTGQGIKCFVNISNYASMVFDKDTGKNQIKIDSKILYALMQAGTVTRMCFEKYNIIKLRPAIIKSASFSYAKLFTKVVSKLYTLVIMPEKQDILMFLSSLFFLHNVMGRDETPMYESNKKYALENCRSTSVKLLEGLYDSIDVVKDFENIDTFLKSMAALIPGLEKLNTRTFIDSYIMSYGQNTILGIEYLPMFLNNLFYVSCGCFLNTQNVIEKMCGEEISILNKEFAALA